MMDRKTHIYPPFFTLHLVLIIMYPGNSCPVRLYLDTVWTICSATAVCISPSKWSWEKDVNTGKGQELRELDLRELLILEVKWFGTGGTGIQKTT